ncbi:MAG: stage II sporulation protein P [Peptostreptococcaceae bacterium]
MKNKRIKAKILACVLICILPTHAFAMDKDDFFKYLIDTSYPETNSNKEELSKKEKDTNTSSEKNEENKDDDYIKVHIGEENIPKIISNEDDSKKEEEKEQTTSAVLAQYKNNIRVTSDKPRMLIYHTHSCETYSNSPAGNYHSNDPENSVLKVGTLLTEELTSKGWGVVHNTTLHDDPSYNNSYSNSYKTVQSMLKQYNNVDIAIDLHRDGKNLNSESAKQEYHKSYTTTINGEKVARISFVVGMKNENLDHVMKIANDLTKIANEKYPGFARPVVKKDNGRYNQYLSKNGMLIEVGCNATSVEEASASAKYIAEVLDSYFK